jgi:uncharacterized protein YbaA (DUF1428 family)
LRDSPDGRLKPANAIDALGVASMLSNDLVQYDGYRTSLGARTMYIAGFVIPVPEEKMEAYRKWVENGAAIFREYGCIEIVESWEDNVPRGKYTDFRRAVDARDDEKIVFSWQVWPDKATLESAEAKMREDERFEVSGEIPFDPKRLILGCFKPIHAMGRE